MYSSSTLEGPAKSGCWKQIDFSEAHADSLFPLEYHSYLGQASHAVLQYCAERHVTEEDEIRKVAEEVGNALIFEGRTFRGKLEPPLPADEVYAGVDVAVAYLLANPLPFEEASPLIPENEWTHPKMPYRALIDLVAVYEEGDEDYPCRVIEVTDYKSSWQAGESELDTLQRWGQAVCVWRNIDAVSIPNIENKAEEADIIRQRAVNLRTWREYTRDIHLDEPEEVAELEQWEKRIEALCERAQSPRTAVPGAGCLSCAYRHICDDCWAEIKVDDGGIDMNQLAVDLARVEAQRSLLIKALKAADINLPIAIPGGFVGFHQKEKRVFRKGQERRMLDDWFAAMAAELPADLAPVLTSLLAALKPGKGNLDAFAKALYPQRAKGIGDVRDEYVNGITDEVRYSQFEVWKDD